MEQTEAVQEFAKDLGIEIQGLYNSFDDEHSDESIGVIMQTNDVKRVFYDRENLQELIDGLQQMANQLPE